ncbi:MULTISPECIES: hypothetical protein [Erythrobacter]|uniref:Uncharacterized protein n=1 Tax=Erythrobacter aureus TaxID=2182384 RepID=A0A345YET0_9SPHN|nr:MULTISPECIES: hypothetical protein [Erythrobacter]AXK42432.1 hypothetical protein DVR09_08895 [Erythrobacter aureus]MBL44449.1 hypothetical protein [Sphingomonadaceae bacterium]MCF8881127.1 hypothetical protein [Erythrobacter sp. SN021]
MNSERIQNALDRIDRALARIETQAALKAHSPVSSGPTNAELVARHEALRESVAASISELDGLIKGLEA